MNYQKYEKEYLKILSELGHKHDIGLSIDNPEYLKLINKLIKLDDAHPEYRKKFEYKPTSCNINL